MPLKRSRLQIAGAVFLSLVVGVLALGWLALVAAELVIRAEVIVAFGVIIGSIGLWRAKRHGLAVRLSADAALRSGPSNRFDRLDDHAVFSPTRVHLWWRGCRRLCESGGHDQPIGRVAALQPRSRSVAAQQYAHALS